MRAVAVVVCALIALAGHVFQGSSASAESQTVLIATLARSDQWLGFRGTNGAGVAESAAALPAEFGREKNLLWRTVVPFARSSPVVTRDRVYVTASEGDTLMTLALDPRTGALLWRREVPRARRMPIYKSNDPASPTPVSDGTNVYVFFAELGLVSYTPDGEERWRVPLGPFASFYGMAGSPVISGDTLVLVCDQRQDSFVIALDTRNGSVRWKKSRSNPVEAFSTPVIYTPRGGPAQVIVFGSLTLDAYALADGERLWWVRQIGSYPVSAPALGADMVFVSAQGADEPPISPFETAVGKYDANRDGLLQAAEMRPNPEIGEHFGWMDSNRDGAADRAEYNFVRASMAFGHGLTAVRLGAAAGDVTASHIAWQVKKQYPYIPSPLLFNDVLYTVRTGGIVMSLNPRTGEVLKTGRVDGALGGYMSSPVAGDGKIFMTSVEGKVSVLRAAGQWEVLAINDLEEECFATPAIAGGRLFIRTRTALYAFGQQAGT